MGSPMQGFKAQIQSYIQKLHQLLQSVMAQLPVIYLMR